MQLSVPKCFPWQGKLGASLQRDTDPKSIISNAKENRKLVTQQEEGAKHYQY